MWLSTELSSRPVWLTLLFLSVHCRAGQEEDPSNPGQCRSCPKGYYKEDDKPEPCKQCKAGNTTENEASTSADDCRISKQSHIWVRAQYWYTLAMLPTVLVIIAVLHIQPVVAKVHLVRICLATRLFGYINL